ncbi:MAG TPA: hypothetical protein VL400_24035, partial [Polyangiaceae bacterium]|nr:hypothetical protein [Polyangiaceae bacterium]
ATGAHDGVLACDGNDLPGVMSARAIVFLAAMGVEPTGNVVIAGNGPWADEALRVLGARAIAKLDADEIALVQGRTSVTGVKTRSGKSIKATLVGVALPGAPAFELAEQAGCEVRATDAGFAVVADADGVAGPGLWAVGECTGAAPDVGAIVLAASRAAESIARALGAQPSRTVSNKPSPPTTKTRPKRPSKTK